MSININVSLNENLIYNLIKTWEAQIQDNINKIQELQKGNAELVDSIKQLKDSLSPTRESIQQTLPTLNGVPTEYHNKWTVFRKIIYFIKKANEPLSTREIIEMILEKEPELKPERTKLVSTVSGVLSQKAKDGKIKRSKNFLDENAYNL